MVWFPLSTFGVCPLLTCRGRAHGTNVWQELKKEWLLRRDKWLIKDELPEKHELVWASDPPLFCMPPCSLARVFRYSVSRGKLCAARTDTE